MPNPTIGDPLITPSGEWLWVPLFRADGTVAIGVTDGVAASGATITIDGVTTGLSDPVRNHMLAGLLYPLCPHRLLRAIDDNNPPDSTGSGWTSAGTWTQVVPSGSVGGKFSFLSANDAEFRTSATGTCTWTFDYDEIVPGRYRVSANLWDLVGPDRSTDAVYTVKDGSGTVLGTFHRDLTQTLHPTFDRARNGMALHDLGYVTLPAGQDVITVTLSNGAGSGLIVADAIFIESAFLSPAQPGSVITASFPAGTATLSGVGTDAKLDAPVGFTTDEEFCHPIHAPADRTMQVGYNVQGVHPLFYTHYLADRSLATYPWSGDVTLDQHYEMVASTGAATKVLLAHAEGDRGLSPWGMDFLQDGVNRFEFNVSGGAFDAAAQANVNVVPAGNQVGPSGAVITDKQWTDLGGGRWRLSCHIARPTWEPISTRTKDFSPYWCQGLAFVVATPGLVYTDWRWYGPEVPIGYTGTANPRDVALYAGKATVIRGMDTLGTNFSPAAKPGDYTTPADRATTATAPTAGFRIAEANVVSLEPVDFDPVTDPHHWHRWMRVDAALGWCVMTLDRDPVAAGFADGVAIQIPGQWGYPATLGGSLFPTLRNYAFNIGGNRLLLQSLVSNGGYDTTGPAQATLTDTQTPVGMTAYVRKNHDLPPETYFDYCNDLGAEPWICFSHIGTPEYVDWLMDMAIARTPDGRVIHGEHSNETWNTGFGQHDYMKLGAVHANWLHDDDPANHPFPVPNEYNYNGHKALAFRKRCRARLVAAGRDPDLLAWHFGAITADTPPTDGIISQANLEGETLDHRDYLTIEAYQNAGPTGGGFAGPDVASTWSRVSPEGVIDLIQASAFHGPRKPYCDLHRGKLDDNGFTACKLSAYEGGWSYVTPDEQRPMDVAEIMTSPRLYRMTASEQSSLQDAGYSLVNKYLDKYYPVPGGIEAWADFRHSLEAAGTGDPAENPNATDYPNLVSQPGGGRLDWAGGFDFVTASFPDPTSLAVTGPGTLTTGTPGTYTATLDGPAPAGGTSFAPSATGFSATFSPDPVAFAEGDSAKTFSATSSTAGTGSIGGTAAGLTVTPRSVTSSTPTPTPGGTSTVPISYSIAGASGLAPIQAAHSTAYKTPAYTLSFWAKIAVTGSENGFFGTSLVGSTITAGFEFEINSAQLYFNVRGASGGAQIVVTGASGGTGWHHVAAACDATDVRVYLDGTIVGTPRTGLGAMVHDTAPLTIARVNALATRFKDGRIFSAKLDATAIANLATGADFLTGCVANWRCNEGTGQVVGDSVGGFTASSTGTIIWDTDVPSQNPGAPPASPRRKGGAVSARRRQKIADSFSLPPRDNR